MGVTAASGAQGNEVALGFRVKSGWAVAVLVAGPATAPKIVDLRRVQLADPSEQETIQPYHAGLELPKGQAAKVVAPLVERVERFADRSMAELFREYRERGHRILAGERRRRRYRPVELGEARRTGARLAQPAPAKRAARRQAELLSGRFRGERGDRGLRRRVCRDGRPRHREEGRRVRGEAR